jgi:hypothetical protein
MAYNKGHLATICMANRPLLCGLSGHIKVCCHALEAAHDKHFQNPLKITMHQNRHMTNISEKIKECRPSRLPRRRRCSRLHHHHHTPHAGGRQDAAYRTPPPPPPPPPPIAPTTGRHHHQHTRCRNHQAHRHHLFKKHERWDEREKH